ncbi:MAG TPA: SusC/RagA family TonB-linked outer membrane protein [Candidatus Kapabacteria bacterium]|nr:SusC/RagA family TonB-linked outer membrane protein [Candidatus Kapabacteria bacterium]
MHRIKNNLEVPHTRFGMRIASRMAAFTIVAAFVTISLFTSLRAQTRATITGTITDADTKDGVPGVVVKITDLAGYGARSDVKGNYSIKNVPAGVHTVEARVLGYHESTKKVTVDADNVTLDFVLSVRAIQQNEIVVTGLSGEIDRKSLGASIGSVNGEDVARVVSSTAIDAISGRVTGVSVTRNGGVVGAGTYLDIRGRKTISGTSEPIYVVDGVIIDNSSLYDDHQNAGSIQLSNRVTDLNPEDIESIEILKGASSSALYGSLAANGVVLITTKKAHVTNDISRASVTLSSSIQSDMASGTIPLQTTFGQSVPYKPGTGGAPGTPGSSTSYGDPLPAGTPTYDHSKDAFRTGTSLINSISISGGTPAFNYVLNGSLENLQGIIINNNMDRRNLRLNIGATFAPELSIQSNTNFINSSTSLPQEGSNTSGLVLGALRTPPEFNNALAYEPDGTQRRFARYDNPFWTVDNNKFNSEINRIIHSSTLKWTPLDWLSVEGRIGADHYEYDNSERLGVGSATSASRLGSVRHELITQTSVNTDLIASAVWKPTDDIVTKFQLGGQTVWGNSTLNDVQATQTLPFYDQFGAGATQTGLSSEVHTKTIGAFLTGQGTWMDRLTLSAGIRRDNSSVFGANNKFHYYPQAGLSYQISDEPFWQDIKSTVSTFRLRASYGEAGNPSLPAPYGTNFLYSTYGFNDPWQRTPIQNTRNGLSGLRQGSGTDQSFILAGNPDIAPELNIERELGFDLGFLNDRLSVEFSYYHQTIFDMIINVPLPTSTGFDQLPENAGSMWNEGFEWGINAIPVKAEDFSWHTGFNYSRNYNLVTSLKVASGGVIDIPGGFTGMYNAAIVGRPLGMLYGTGWLRDSKGNIVYSSLVKGSKGQDSVANDFGGNNYVGAPQIDQNALHVIGDPNAHWQFSWSNDFKIFKDLSVSFLIDGMIGQQIWNGTKGTLYNFGTAADTKDRNQIWVNNRGDTVMDYSDPTKPVPVTKIALYQQYSNGFFINEPFIEDGSYVKLREVSISYDWHGLRDWKIETVRFTVTARNLHTWTNYTGYDPEINTFAQSEARGYDYFTISQSRSYRFGISLTY